MNKRAAAIAIILATVSHQALSNDYLLRVKTPDTEVIGVNDWIITETLGEWIDILTALATRLLKQGRTVIPC